MPYHQATTTKKSTSGKKTKRSSTGKKTKRSASTTAKRGKQMRTTLRALMVPRPPTALRERAKRASVRITRKVNGKRVYRTGDEIEVAIAAKKLAARQRNACRSACGTDPARRKK